MTEEAMNEVAMKAEKSRTLDRVDRFFLTAYIATLAFVYIALIIALG